MKKIEDFLPKMLFDASIKDFLRLEANNSEISNENNEISKENTDISNEKAFKNSSINDETLIKLIKASPKLQVFLHFSYKLLLKMSFLLIKGRIRLFAMVSRFSPKNCIFITN